MILTMEKMKFVDSTATVGDNPCYVSLVGNTVFTANYTGGSLNTFKISNDKISLQNAIKFNNACKKRFRETSNVSHTLRGNFSR